MGVRSVSCCSVSTDFIRRFSTARRAAVEGVADGDEQAVEVGRLLDEVERPAPRRLDGGLDGAVAGDHDDRRLRHLVGGDAEDVETVHLGHLDVEEREVVAALAQHRDRRLAVFGLLDVVVFVLENLAQGAADRALVVDDEDGGHRGRRDEGERRRERAQTKRAPRVLRSARRGGGLPDPVSARGRRA